MSSTYSTGPLRAARPAAAGIARGTLGLAAIVVAGCACAAAAAIGGVIPYALGTILIFLFLYLSTHVTHEAVHRNISGQATAFDPINDVIGRFVSFFLFVPFGTLKAVHLTHHRSTNDPDLDGDMWLARRTPLGVFLACCTLTIGYELTLYRLVRRGLAPKSLVTELWVQRVLSVALVTALVAAGWGREVWYLWILPAFMVLPVFAFCFAWIVHHPHTARDRYGATNLWAGRSPLLDRLAGIASVGQTYHLVHHLYPRVPFYRYRQVWQANEADIRARGGAIREF